MNYLCLLILFLYSNYCSSMDIDKDITKSTEKVKEEKNESLQNNLKRRSSPPNLTNSDKKKIDDISLVNDLNKNRFKNKTEKIFFSQKSFNSMDTKKHEAIILEVPKEIAQSLQVSHQIDHLVHEELNKKIEGIEYSVNQMCKKGFETKDELIKISNDQRRAHNQTRILLLGCIACSAFCIVLSVTGIVLGIHFIPLK